MNVMPRKNRYAFELAVVLLFCGIVFAQDDTAPGQSSGTPSDTNGAPPAATGTPGQSMENPPLSGLDVPTAEPAFGGRSYLQPALQFSESANSNATGTNNSNYNGISATSQGLGSLDLQKLWKRYAIGLDYVAGGVAYSGPTLPGRGNAYQVHTLASDQRILWRTGQLAIRDSFDYLPEGTFGFNSMGGAGSFGSALGGIAGAGSGLGGGISGGSPAGLFGAGSFGYIGFEPRIDNLAIIDITQELSPRSTVTLGGGYDIGHYLNSPQASFPIVDSEQATGQVGYDRILNQKNQIGVLYAFQEFHFPLANTGDVRAEVWNALYAHRISGRLNLVLAGGPQLVDVHRPPVLLLGVTIPLAPTETVSANGSVTLQYTVSSRTSGQVLYQRYITPGSGFYAGADTNAARLSMSHLFGRRWTGATDCGYSHNSALQNASPSVGLNAHAYQFWYAGGSLRRHLGPHFDAFASYQFNDFGSTACTSSKSNVCGQAIERQTGMVGITWHPRPIRLD
jgi:hypothetical protein